MIVGIDLGTTNSLVGVWRDGDSAIIPNSSGRLLTPSVVAEDGSGRIVVGEAARDLLVARPGSAVAHFKRYMGTDRSFRLAGKAYRSDELSALVLAELKRDAEAFLGETVTEAVITVPAYFNDAQRKATKIAGQLAGLKVEKLLTEPTAAALAYGFGTDGDESTVLVVDLGGGTLDVSLLHAFEGIMEVKATAGDIWLGGEDFTDRIAACFMAQAGQVAGIPPLTASLPVHATLRRQAERAKRLLGETGRAELTVQHNNKDVSWTLTREMFEQISEPLLARVRLPLERALRDARIEAGEISRIIFAGGATRMPMFRRLITRLFHQIPVQHISPDEAVARGAAVRAGLMSGGAGLEEHVLTDVTPFTLGVAVRERNEAGALISGLYLPIVERNTVIPASRSHVLTTSENNQPRVRVQIYQGESRHVSENVFLGQLECDVPVGPAGKEAIDVRFSYDTSGLLDVDVTVVSTKQHKRLVIEGNPGVLTKAEIAERLTKLAALNVHPRDEAENVAVLARAKRVYEEALGDARLSVGQALDAFSHVLNKQHPQEIAQMRTRLSDLLDGIDRNYLD